MMPFCFAVMPFWFAVMPFWFAVMPFRFPNFVAFFQLVSPADLPEHASCQPSNVLTEAGQIREMEKLMSRIGAFMGEEETDEINIAEANDRPTNQFGFIAWDHLVRKTFGIDGVDALPLRRPLPLKSYEKPLLCSIQSG